MEENMNFNVEKKKRSIVPILFIIIVVLVVVLGILLYDKTNKNNVDTQNNEVENKVDGKENISNDNTENVESNVNNDQEATNTQNNQVNNDAIAKAYEKIKDVWLSQVDKAFALTVNDGKIIYSYGDIQNREINFEYGKVKGIGDIYTGGLPNRYIILTEEGEAYCLNVQDGLDYEKKFDQSKFKYDKIDLGEKIVDIAICRGAVPFRGQYYLTESGKLLTENGKTYDEINRNHVEECGYGGQLYINSDKTLEYMRTYNTYEYMDIVNQDGEKIKAKYVVCASNNDSTIKYYVVDENDKLLSFSEKTLMIASIDYNSNGKTVSKLEYNGNNSTVKVIFTDGTNIVIENVSSNGYKEVK